MKKDQFLKTHGFKNMTVDNRELELDSSAIWVIGPNAQFRNCTFHSKVKSSQIIVSTSTLLECHFTAEVKLVDVDWSPAKLVDCVFAGSFSGCDFGARPDLEDESAFGTVEGTDFSNAVLDACRFFNVNMQSIRFPLWPCFTIIDHEAAAHDFLRSDFSGWAMQYATETLSDVEEGEVALSLLAANEAKRLRCSQESLRHFLVGKTYVIL